MRAAALATRLETRLGSSGSSRPSARAERSTATTALATEFVSRCVKDVFSFASDGSLVPSAEEAQEALSWIRANRQTTLAPSCLRNAGRAYVPTPARCFPALRSASVIGPTHHARHEANAVGEPAAATVVSSFPARRGFFFSARLFSAPGRAVSLIRASASSSSVVVSKRSDCETAATSAPAAVHTESSFIALNVFASRSGARLSSRFAPSRRATAARGTYLPLRDASFLSRLLAASSRNAFSFLFSPFPVIPPRASSMSSSVSKLKCVSLTVCDKGSSQLAQRMAQTRSRNGAGNASSKEKNQPSSSPDRSRRRTPDAASALTRTSAARSAAAAWYLWCESSGRSRDAQMYGSK